MLHKLLHHEISLKSKDVPWIIFIHGAGGNISTWKQQRELLKENYNLLLLDLRDHGKSKDIAPFSSSYSFELITDDILKVIDHARIKEATFISLSLGSVVLQKIYLQRPRLFEGMVIIGGIFKINWKIRTFIHTARFFNLFLPYRAMYNLFSWLVMPRPNHAYSRKVFVQQSRKLNREEYFRWITLYQDLERVVEEFGDTKILCPQWVVMGREDWVFLGSAKEFADFQEYAKLDVFGGAGHICHLEKPQEFNNLLLDFLAKKTKKIPL